MKKQILIHGLAYGLCGGILIATLKLIEFRFLVVEHSVEIYGGLIALLFAALGIWLGLKLTRTKEVLVDRCTSPTVKEGSLTNTSTTDAGALLDSRATAPNVPVSVPQSFALNQARLRELGITKRELEILELIAKGMSNREIAAKLFVSENTVKTHSSRLFEKLSAKRRTQAVQIGKEIGLIA